MAARNSTSSSYEDSSQALRVDLAAGIVSFPGQPSSTETLVGVETVYAGLGDDTLIGSTVANSFYGFGGNDLFDGGGGTDFFDGGAGADTVVYTANTTPVVINLVTGTAAFTGKPWPTETFVSIENATAGSGDDTLIGGADNNTLDGGSGNDRIDGGARIEHAYWP